jgi:predicted membrane protein
MTKENYPTSARSFHYKLTYEEIYEAFFLLSFRIKKQVRVLFGILLTAIAVIMLVLFALNNTRIYYSYIAVIAILLLFYMIYYPILKSRKGAKIVAENNGFYKVSISSDGTLTLNKNRTPLNGDKHARAIETVRSFIIRPDAFNTICIPKRIMRKNDIDFVRKVLKEKVSFTSSISPQ